jgi:hypothetical protein
LELEHHYIKLLLVVLAVQVWEGPVVLAQQVVQDLPTLVVEGEGDLLFYLLLTIILELGEVEW